MAYVLDIHGLVLLLVVCSPGRTSEQFRASSRILQTRGQIPIVGISDITMIRSPLDLAVLENAGIEGIG